LSPNKRRQPLEADQGLVALSGCRVSRPVTFQGGLEIVTAGPEPRGFPLHVNEGLGVCLKIGESHAVRSDGRALTYPADSICVRHPGCVWSSEVAAVGFVSIDIAPSLLPEGIVSSAMRFLPASKLPDLRGLARKLEADPTPLCREEALAELFSSLFEHGAFVAHELQVCSVDAGPLRARDFLRSRLATNPSLDELARATGINKFVLIRQFKRRFGTTPHRFLVSLRVERARSLLAAGTAPVEVAASLGFADQGHFGRHFKRLVGIAPSEFARTVRTSVALPGG
jgi:AraC-like DNA-binding protein